MRTFSTHRAASMAASGLKWISATIGTSQPRASKPSLIGFRFLASFTVGAVIRTISQPTATRSMGTSIQHRNWQQINHGQVNIEDDTEPKRQLPTKFTLKKNVVSPHDHDRTAHVLQLNIGLRRKQCADCIGKGLDAGRNLFQR